MQPISQYVATKLVRETNATISVAVGDVGNLKTYVLDFAPILSSNGSQPGKKGDSSILGLGNGTTVFGTLELDLRTDEQFSDGLYPTKPGPINAGEYAVDYGNGILYLVPKASGSLALTYYIRASVHVTG